MASKHVRWLEREENKGVKLKHAPLHMNASAVNPKYSPVSVKCPPATGQMTSPYIRLQWLQFKVKMDNQRGPYSRQHHTEVAANERQTSRKTQVSPEGHSSATQALTRNPTKHNLRATRPPQASGEGWLVESTSNNAAHTDAAQEIHDKSA